MRMLKMRPHIRIPLNGQNKENATEIFEDVQLYFRTYSKSLSVITTLIKRK